MADVDLPPLPYRSHEPSFRYTVVIVLMSSVLFRLMDLALNALLRFNLSMAQVQVICRTEKSKWRFKNVGLSLIHSVVSAVWSVYCFYDDPDLAEDMIDRSSTLSFCLVSFSIGYFLHDVYHLLANDKSRDSIELLPHHVIVILCFGISVCQNRYIGYAVVALLVEINSIFLHVRQLLLIMQFSKDCMSYRINSLINLGTFVLCRLTTLGWMTRWLVMNRDRVSLISYTVGSVGLAIIMLINLILFCRLLNSDFLKKRKST